MPIEANTGGAGAGREASNAGSQDVDASRDSEHGVGNYFREQSADKLLLKASPDDPKHPGWPAGTPGGIGGQFRPKDGDGGGGSPGHSGNSSGAPNETSLGVRDGTRHADLEQGPQYAALETGTRTDASNPVPGAQYAAGRPQVVIDPSALTGIQQVDDTTKKLAEIFANTIDELKRDEVKLNQSHRHCEERTDEAIQPCRLFWIASLRSQ